MRRRPSTPLPSQETFHTHRDTRAPEGIVAIEAFAPSPGEEGPLLGRSDSPPSANGSSSGPVILVDKQKTGTVTVPASDVKLDMRLNNLTWKDYSENRQYYQFKFPLNIDCIIPADDSVRLLSLFIDEMDLEKLYQTYFRRTRKNQATPFYYLHK